MENCIVTAHEQRLSLLTRKNLAICYSKMQANDLILI